MRTKWLFFGGAAGIVGALLLQLGVPAASVLVGVALAGGMTVLDARRRLPSRRQGR